MYPNPKMFFMNQLFLNKFEENLKRFAEAKDPRHLGVVKQEITKCFNSCSLENKELLTEMSFIFFKTKQEKSSVDWSNIEFLLFGKIIQCVDFYISTKEEALDHLSEGDHPRQILSHLMKKYSISAAELRSVRENVLQ